MFMCAVYFTSRMFHAKYPFERTINESRFHERRKYGWLLIWSPAFFNSCQIIRLRYEKMVVAVGIGRRKVK